MRKIVPHSEPSPWWAVAYWWAATVVVLTLLDDLLFGPAFWGLAQLSQVAATATAFCVSFVFQLWLVKAGVNLQPGKWARFFLKRLLAERAAPQIARREASIHHRIGSLVAALAVSLVVGGVIPILLLHRQGRLSPRSLHWVPLATAGIYAAEFALIHGGYGIGGLIEWLV